MAAGPNISCDVVADLAARRRSMQELLVGAWRCKASILRPVECE